MTLRSQLRAALSVQTLKLIETVIEGVDQVRGRPSGHAATDWAVVKNDDLFTFPRQQVSRCHPRDARANDTNIGARVCGQGAVGGNLFAGRHPDRSSLAGIAFH